MDAEKTTLLERLIELSFPLNLIYKARNSAYTKPIAELILASQSIAERAKNDWTYKSLAEFGEEEFIRAGHIFYADERRDWVNMAIQSFSECVYRQVWYEENEGLIFYVQEDEKFRAAKIGDPSYDFVCRLREEGALGNLYFSTTPKWAHELYLFRPNYEAYCLIWHDYSKLSDPRYAQAKRVKADAVVRETIRLAGLVDTATDSTPTAEVKPLSTNERNTLLTIITALCDYSAIKYQERGAANQIAKLTDEIGAPISDETIRKVLKQIPDALAARKI
jgi:hypothetical protein